MNKPDKFEEQLAQAMRRVNAPETLERFLMLATEAEQHRLNRTRNPARILSFGKPPAWLWNPLGGAIAALLVLGCFVGGGIHVQRQHERAAQAEREFEAAQRITDHALAHTREQLKRAGVSLDDLQ